MKVKENILPPELRVERIEQRFLCPLFTFVLHDEKTGRDYIVVCNSSGLAITPRLEKEIK